jgi:hypothetical protein
MGIAAQTPVPTPDGWRRAIDLREGDLVFTQLGTPQEVKSVQAYMADPCFRVHFDDGLSLDGDRHMTLPLQDKVYRDNLSEWLKNRGKKYAKPNRSPLRMRRVKDLHNKPLVFENNRKIWSVQNCSPVAYPWRDLPVQPYVFGAWFGSMTRTKRHVVAKENVQKINKRLRQHGFLVVAGKVFGKGRNYIEFRPSVKDSFLFADALIPNDLPFYYIESAPEQRIELLEGLIDAGFFKKSPGVDRFSVTRSHWGTARRAQMLVESLGYKTKMEKRDDKPGFRLSFSYTNKNTAFSRRYLVGIDKIKPRQCAHIITNEQFLAGEGFISVC